MWSLFIALFGGVYWMCKLCGERSEAKATDRRIATMRAQSDRWEVSVRDDQLNAYTLRMAETRDGFLELEKEALDIIHQLPGMENAKSQGYMSDEARIAVQFIFMVKRGKLPHGCCYSLPMSLWRFTNVEFSKRSIVALALWVESTMQQYGYTNARLYYSTKFPGAVNRYDKTAYFQWEVDVTHPDCVVRATDPNIEQIMFGESTEMTEYRNAHRR